MSLDERPSPGRYRGRRRVPAAPRSRYAAAITTAVVGAGVVALGFGNGLSDAKADTDRFSALGGLDTSLADRAEAVERASRAERESGGLATSIPQRAPEVWLLPTRGYTVSSPFGLRWGSPHNGVDLAAPQGTPLTAIHAGTVTNARWSGGYGYLVIIDHGDGTESWYGHTSELLVSEGDEVSAGDTVALMGNTGYSFGSHLHLEIHVDGVPVEPVAWLAERGVDIASEVEEIYAPAGA
jgi:murein DD-endopeptidase MepM/ murein hydrolase activator NlpD